MASALRNKLAPVGVGLITMRVNLIMMLSITPALTLIGVSALVLDLFVVQCNVRRR